MARTLDIPEDLPDAFQQGITSISFNIPHEINETGDAMKINKVEVHVKYSVTTWDNACKVIDNKTRGVIFADWPVAFITDMKAVYAKLELDAENSGLIYGPGTDEPLE